MLQFETSGASPIWPPAGIAIASATIFGYRIWPSIFVGAFTANFYDAYVKFPGELQFIDFTLSSFDSWGQSIIIAIGNTCEALFCIFAMKKLHIKNLFSSVNGVVESISIIALSCLFSSIIGCSSLLIFNIISREILLSVWITWYLGDFTGAIILLPFLLSFFDTFTKPHRSNLLYFIAPCLNAIAATVIFLEIFETPQFLREAYLLIPFIIWTTFSCPLTISLLSILIICSIGVVGTVNNLGPFVRENQNQSLILIQGFSSIITLMAVVIERTLSEKKSAMKKLSTLNNQLDLEVQKRSNQLIRTNQELADSNKELDDFAYIAAHDLKEPLHSISLIANDIREAYCHTLPTEVKFQLGKIDIIAIEMEKLLSTLLHYSRVGRSKLPLDNVDLNKVVDDVIFMMSPKIKATNIEIRRQPLPIQRCNAARVAEIYRNLISNAIKFNDKEHKWIEIGCKSDHGQHIYFVKDNGIGIRAQHLDDIFTIFTRLSESASNSEGDGAGMTIVKKIIERHQGHIWVESKYGEGTQIYFTLSREAIDSYAKPTA